VVTGIFRHTGVNQPLEPQRTGLRAYDGWLESAWMGFGGLVLMLATAKQAVFVSPIALFWIVLVAASLCVIAALSTLYVAHQDNLAELGLMSGFTFTLSALPLVHGITTPGVLFGPNLATLTSVLWATPIAAIAVLPLAFPKTALAGRILSKWKHYVGMQMFGVTALALGLMVRPGLLPAFAMRSVPSMGIVAVSIGVCMFLSVRHLRFAQIAQSTGPLAVSFGFVLIGLSNLVWLSTQPFTPLFWFAHLFDIAGVFVLTLVAMRAYHQQPSIRSLIGPLVAQTPLSAFELGLEPLVHRFVASLERKDTVTRDHVARTAELAMNVGIDLGLKPDELHTLGLGALLHDIGKLSIDDNILHKPSGLNDVEFAAMKRHTEYGEALVSSVESLRSIAPIVRGHHERIDGRGYPDRLHGDEIPLLARIVSACDAYDAMSNTRQYRTGMEQDKVFAILREHAGSQWDERVIGALINRVTNQPSTNQGLKNVGRDTQNPTSTHHDELCGCLDQSIELALAQIAADQQNMTV
jgi:HD-GYP domain-containing protein (c-di-GMP phosphodiesterase class II)